MHSTNVAVEANGEEEIIEVKSNHCCHFCYVQGFKGCPKKSIIVVMFKKNFFLCVYFGLVHEGSIEGPSVDSQKHCDG